MSELTKVSENRGKVYLCKTCKTEFIIPETETAACCPICRMNRIEPLV